MEVAEYSVRKNEKVHEDILNDKKDHEEYQYLQLINKIIKHGIKKSDRTGTGTFTIAGPQMRFNLRNGIILFFYYTCKLYIFMTNIS